VSLSVNLLCICKFSLFYVWLLKYIWGKIDVMIVCLFFISGRLVIKWFVPIILF
jgi:hypothetical protein